MFWDIFENGNEKYKLKKEIPEGFVFEVKDNIFLYLILKYGDLYEDYLSYPCEDLDRKIKCFRRNSRKPKYTHKYLKSFFPKGKGYSVSEDRQLYFYVSALLITSNILPSSLNLTFSIEGRRRNHVW